MKKILLSLIILTAAISTYAQPRAVGLRIGATGLDAAYQHNMNKNQFIEGNFGLDFGYKAVPGVKATATYNFIWARPAWTDKGTWALYAGPGVTLGYVNDMVYHKVGREIINYPLGDNGFMMGLCGQVGLEYTFWFPLQLALDLRPCIGMHINTGYDSRIGFYDKGLAGFAPTVSVRYRF